MPVRYAPLWSATDSESESTRRLVGPAVNGRPCTLRRHGRDATPERLLTWRIGWRETEFAQQHAQNDVRLQVGESGTDATVDAATERDPCHGLRGRAHVAVRVERPRVREVAFGGVSQLDADDDVGALRKDPLAQPDSRLRSARRSVQHRAGALHFPDRGLPQFATAGIRLVGKPLAQVWVPAQPFQRPGQRRRGGLVTGTQQRQQLVGDVLVGDRLTVFVAGLQQQCQHVFTLLDGRIGACLGDQRGDDRVEPAPLLHVAPPRAPRPEVRAHDRWADHQQRAERHHRRHGLPKLLQRSTFGAEYRAQDHPDGDSQHRFQCLELPALGPGRSLALDLFFDDPVVAAHPLAVERRCQQFAAIAVLVAGEAERRSRPERSTDRPVARRRTLDKLGAGAEQLLGQHRVVDHHRVVVVGQVDTHDVAAVALADVLEHGVVLHQELDSLDQLRSPGTGRQPHRLGRRRYHVFPSSSGCCEGFPPCSQRS